MHFFTRLSYLTFAGSVAFWGAVTYRLLAYDENHVGWNILIVVPAFVGGTIAAIVAARSTGQTRHLVSCLTGILSIVLAIVCYQFNVLIPYEAWLARGMPPRPF